jgi:hypothetical protein
MIIAANNGFVVVVVVVVVVQQLLKTAADRQTEDRKGMTALQAAVFGEHRAVMWLLKY